MEKTTYRMDDADEIMEYIRIKPELSGLDVDLFADESSSYLRRRHPLLVLARNGYGHSCSGFIPISVGPHPTVLDEDMELHISYDDIFSIQDFIVANQTLLERLANDTSLTEEEFAEALVRINSGPRALARLLNDTLPLEGGSDDRD